MQSTPITYHLGPPRGYPLRGTGASASRGLRRKETFRADWLVSWMQGHDPGHDMRARKHSLPFRPSGPLAGYTDERHDWHCDFLHWATHAHVRWAHSLVLTKESMGAVAPRFGPGVTVGCGPSSATARWRRGHSIWRSSFSDLQGRLHLAMGERPLDHYVVGTLSKGFRFALELCSGRHARSRASVFASAGSASTSEERCRLPLTGTPENWVRTVK